MAAVEALIIYNEIRGNRKTQIAKFGHNFLYSLVEMMQLQHENVTQTTCSRRSSAASTLSPH